MSEDEKAADPSLESSRKEQLNLFPGFISISAGKDELNIAEFPIAALANRMNPEIKTITYQDEIQDAKTGQLMPRSLTITGSDLYGLPTSFDDEVILGLINLSRGQGFQSPSMNFNRHQVISVLGWSNDDYYYQRIKESVNRWLGVTLYYENAWRDKGSADWKTGGFHLIESVTWGKDGQPSEIIWGKEVFKSFTAGNLKALDLDLYRQLSTPTARRIYRFLDKRFFQRAKWKFDLNKFAFHKIGLSQTAYKDVAQLKRQMRPAIKQLEDAQVIMACPDSERFRKLGRGKWEIHFERFSKEKQPDLEMPVEEETELESKLVKYGVGRTVARRLLVEHGEARVRERLAWYECLEAKKKTGGIKSVPGYLVKSITDPEFAAPDGYKSPEELAREKAEKAAVAKKKALAKQLAEKSEKEREEAAEREMRAAEKVFNTLSEEQQAEIETVALKNCPFDAPRIRKMLVFTKVAEMLKKGDLNKG
ncbi:MAG: replication initiator protein A [Verrucomicrobiae bacterium]|nr:replication initiator protein A [Verrucomicrobiae bacterium]